MQESIVHAAAPGPLTARIGYALAQAFYDAPDYRFILVDRPDRVSALSWFFGSFAARLALRYGHVLTTPEGTAGLLLFAPGKSPSVAAVIQAGVLSLPRRFGMRGAWRALLLGMHLERQRLKLAPVPHFYVIAVGVTPSRQGQGVGSALLRQIIQQCDSENTPCYLEVFEDLLVDRYRQMGFRVLQQETLANGLTLWCMLRQAGAERAN